MMLRRWSVLQMGRLAMVASVVIVLVPSVLLTPAADASKGVVETFGQAGAGAGEFAFAAGVRSIRATGDVYVADADCCDFDTGGQRVLQFDADGGFIRAWGWGVAPPAAEQFEVCTTSSP